MLSRAYILVWHMACHCFTMAEGIALVIVDFGLGCYPECIRIVWQMAPLVLIYYEVQHSPQIC